MNRTRNALVALALLGGFVVPVLYHAPQARADDDEKELKKARKAVKKNMKKLLKAADELEKAKERLRITSVKEEQKREEIGAQIDQLRAVCFQTIEDVRKADDDKAAEYLCEFATTVRDEDVYERVVDELYRLEHKESIDWMVGVLNHEDKGKRGEENVWKLQILCANALAGVEGEDIDQAFARILEHGTNAPVVNAVVQKARDRKAPIVIKGLIDLLGRVEAKGGWEYYTVRQVLTSITGEDFFTKEKWANYWAKVENGWDPSKKGETQEAATRERGPQETIPTFFGSEIESNRMMFVIDSSGSMQMTDKPKDSDMSDADYRAADPDSDAIKANKRMERAKRETMNAIKALQPTQRFNVIDFDSGAHKWQENLVDATEANKEAAVEWIKGSIVDSGGTYTDVALELAFSDPEVDTIYLLSDGAPFQKIGNPAPRDEWPKDANGKTDDNQPVAGEQQIQFAGEMITKILDYVRFENRFRHVKIFTFGMDGPGVWHKKWPQPRPVTLPTDARWLSTLSNFMRELAAITGGEYRSI